MRKWFEIIAHGPMESAETAVDLLIQAGSPGVMEEERGGEKILRAYLSAESFMVEKRNLLHDGLKKIGWTYTHGEFKDVDWLTEWKKGLKPIRISRRIMVKPTWEKITAQPGTIVIEIDPGMAFGTGSHATTSMCLKAADRLSRLMKGKNVLDVGTGSGILAIVAAKLGAKKIVAVDIDPEALKVARKNVKLNGASAKIHVSKKPLEKIHGKFSIIFANIIAEELMKIAYLLKEKAAHNGHLILSGILQERAKEVEAVYKRLGFKLFKRYTKGEWVSLVFNQAR